jgi:hypothetical protein
MNSHFHRGFYVCREASSSTLGVARRGSLYQEPLLPRHLENHFQLDRRAERKACDAIHQTARAPVFSEDVLQQLRSGVGHLRLFADVSRRGDRHAEADNPCHVVERSQMLPRDSEDVERREASSLAACFHIEFCADAPNEFGRTASVGSIPLRKSRLPRTAEKKASLLCAPSSLAPTGAAI